MEFERSLFRIYERSMSSENFYLWIKVLTITFFVMSGISLSFLLYFHISFINQGEIISKALSEQILNGASQYSSLNYNLTLDISQNSINPNTTLLPEDIYNISIGSLPYRFSACPQCLFMPIKIGERLNFTVHVIKLKYSDFMPGPLWPFAILYNEIDTIVINQLGKTFSPHTGMLINTKSKESWYWSENKFKDLSNQSIRKKLYNGLVSLGNFIIISLITGLICRVAIAGSAGVILSLYWLMKACRASENTIMILFYSFPWVGHPAYVLRNAGKSIFGLITSFFVMLIVFYFMYACAYVIWNAMIFEISYPQSVDEKIYTAFSIIEFYSLIYIRSKKSVLVFPRVVLVLMFLVFMYGRNNFYPFLNTFFTAVMSCCLGCMVLVVGFLEKPTFNNEGPSFESPRLVYQPVYSRNITALPEIWTMFYPVAGRGHFTEDQMSNIFPRQGPV